MTTTSPASKLTSSGTAAQRLSALSSSLNNQNTTSALPQMSAFPPLSQSPTPLPLPGSSNNVTDPIATYLEHLPQASTSAATSNIPHTQKSPWQIFTTHLEPLSLSQRADFIGRLSRAERYYATLEQLAVEKQGPHMTPVGLDTIQNLREQGAIGLGFSSQTTEELDASIEALLDDLDLMAGVRAVEEQTAKDFDAFTATQTSLLAGSSSSQVVHIGGLPFLLQIPPQFAVSHADRKQAFIQLRKYQMIRHLLSTMLNIARSHSQALDSPYHPLQRQQDLQNRGAQRPPIPGMAMPQGLPNGFRQPRGLGALGIGAQAAARLAAPGMPTARLAVVINLDEILALAMPLLFLSIKLAFLIYIFGKHATRSKRIVMCAMALAWVIWEGITIRRRRRAAELRRQQQGEGRLQPAGREDRRRDRQGVVALDPPLNLNGQGGGGQHAQLNQPADQQYMPPALAQLRDRVAQDADQQVGRRHGRVRNGPEEGGRNGPNGRPAASSSRSSSNRHPNRLSPKYWLYQIAKTGLSAEAREMGLTRTALRNLQSSNRQGSSSSSQSLDEQGQSVPQSGHSVYQARGLTARRALRNVYIGVVLFVGTLIPEVERLRRKALLKREKKLAEVVLGQRQLRLSRLEAELANLEEERRALESELGASAGAEPGRTDSRPNYAPSNHAQAERLPPNANLNDGRATTPDDEGMWDPPFDGETLKRALADGPSSTISSNGADQPLSGQGQVAGPASPSTSGPPSIRIDTSVDTRDTHLSPNQNTRARDLDANYLDDDLSAPSTPLLSPAEPDTEEEDDRQEGVDDEVGM